MTPLDYLREEFENVSTTLKETLRHDFGPSDGKAYFNECKRRLETLKRQCDKISEPTDGRIPDQLDALAGIANRVSLIERSHLGEFSWPFAEAIRSLANGLVVEKDLRGEISPHIVHMIAEGTGYHIRTERHPDRLAKRRLAIVAFPRQLKHHVLMHALFGHELGHAAFFTNVAGAKCRGQVIPELKRQGPLATTQALTEWLNAEAAPEIVKDRLKRLDGHSIRPSQLDQWALELMCDLFGLLTFGPAFVAAHRTLLEPSSRSPHDVELTNSTHPPLAVRRAMLVKAMRLLEWDKPTIEEEGTFKEAEKAMIDYVMEPYDDEWSDIFSDEQLKSAVDKLKTVFEGNEDLEAQPPEGEVTSKLVDRLSRRLPPIFEEIDAQGQATYRDIRLDQCLYAGWVYWLGREKLEEEARALTFIQTNRLCDQALLQQRSIELSKTEGVAA